MTVILLTSGAVVLLTCAAFLAYEWVAFRRELVGSLTTIAQITADNTTAALAFENESDAKEVLSALRIERSVVEACLYDKVGKLFARYPPNEPVATFPAAPEKDGHRFTRTHLILFEPVGESGQRLGTLYLRSDVSAMYERFQLYGGVAVLVMVISGLVAFAISAALQNRISRPILSLADTAKAISDRRDYSVRARKVTQDELGQLTDAFNQMLNQIQAQDSALRVSEARKGAILESALDGIITIDHEGKVVEFNPAAERMFGYTRDQLIGREMADSIIPPSLRERHRHGMAHFMATGEGSALGRRLELTALRADGTEFPVELSISRIGSEDPPTFTGFLRDITERKRAEGELRRLAHFPEQNPSPVLRIRDDGALLYANPAARLFLAELGWKSDGVLPDVVRSVMIEARRQAGLIEREICCPAGQIIWITAVPFDDDHYVNFYGRDITERKQAEERFRLVVEAAPNAMVMVDQTGKITLVNAQTEKLFGYGRDELLGQSVEFLVPERFRAAHPGHRARFFAKPSARPMGAGRDLYGVAKDGREIPIEIGLNPIRMTERQFVLASIIDITERKQVEQVLLDLNAELERRVATRTAELEVEVTERRRAEQVIRTALEEKRTLLEEIHHRVKNNLQVICSLLELQGACANNQEDVTMFQECQNRVRTMAMVHERLYRSQNLASVDFGEHVRDLVSMLANTYRQAAAQVQVFTEAESVQLQLETAIPAGLIVNELVSNALKHAFPNGRRGTLKVSFHSPMPGQLLLSVEDDGVGPSQGARLDQGRSLGLRMVRDLTRQIRGTLEIRQTGGTLFALSFPVAKPRHKPLLQP
jgi:PAS domain S-box-containing protein